MLGRERLVEELVARYFTPGQGITELPAWQLHNQRAIDAAQCFPKASVCYLDDNAGQGRPDLSATERKHRIYRLRARLRDALREEILESVERQEDLDSEIRELFSAFS